MAVGYTGVISLHYTTLYGEPLIQRHLPRVHPREGNARVVAVQHHDASRVNRNDRRVHFCVRELSERGACPNHRRDYEKYMCSHVRKLPLPLPLQFAAIVVFHPSTASLSSSTTASLEGWLQCRVFPLTPLSSCSSFRIQLHKQ